MTKNHYQKWRNLPIYPCVMEQLYMPKAHPFSGGVNPAFSDSLREREREREKRKSLHNLALIPHECVGVEVLGGVEPEVQSLFSVAHTIDINIGLNQVGLPSGVAQELEIKFIVIWSI